MRITKGGLDSFTLYYCVLTALLLFGCKPNTIHFNELGKPAAVASQKPLISNIQVINDQIVITGSNLGGVQIFAIKEGATTTPMTIESKSNTSLVANTLSNVTFAAGKVFSFILSNASAASTFTVNFSLCDSDLNGKGFNCSITPNDKDVLSFDANTNKWVPRNVNGLSYKGTHSATGGTDPGGAPANGDYYIISAPGTINTVPYAIGDWIVYNSDDSIWQKISNSKDVISVYGRTGKVSAKEGDYNLDKLSDVNVTTTPPVTNDVLKYNGTTWVPGAVTTTEADPTVQAFAKASLPTCSAGQVLRSNGTSLSCVTDGSFTGTANRVVTTNGTGQLTISTITDTILGYLSGLTGNVQTQLDAKANSAAIVDYSTAGLPLVHSTRVYGGSAQASKTLVTDASGNITTSAVTPTELGYLTGATSNIQAQLNTLSGAGQWLKTGSDLGYASGKVGVGTTAPATSLEVTGEVKVGNTAIACSTTTRGSIRYNTGSNVLEFCNGTGWHIVQGAACSDPTPNATAFTHVVNATTATLYTSDIVQVTGLDCSVPVTVSGTGTPQFRICSDSSCATVIQGWTNTPSTISNGQYLQTRLTSDVAGGSTYQSMILIGSGAAIWNVTTIGDCTGSPTSGTVCADGTIYVGLSPDGSTKMYTTRCDAGQTWDGVTCSGTRMSLSFNNGTTTYSVTGTTSSLTGESNTTTLAGLSNSSAPYGAASYCDALVANGSSDWYLPATSELVLLYNGRTVIKNFSTGSYWTSTDGDVGSWEGRIVVFSSGSATSNHEYYQHSVRCVRKD